MNEEQQSNTNWKFWHRVYSKDEAINSIRMSGLPIMIIGISTALAGIIRFDSEFLIGSIVICLIGCFLIWSSIQLRNGKTFTFIPSIIFWIIGYIRIISVVIFLGISPSASIALFIYTLCGILAFNGIRGYLWLRKNS